jgi:hypothetical protein
MLETVGHYAQRQSLDLGLRFCGGRSVSKDAGQLRDLGEPPPVLLTVDVYPEPHEVILLPLVWSPENTKISSEGRHRECPDLVCCILLFCRSLFFQEGPFRTVHLL